MKGNINLQQVVELLRKQQHQHQTQKEKSISLKSNPRPQISPKYEQQRWFKKEPKSQAQQLTKEYIQDLDLDPPKV
jgi:hypothetical protein